MKKTAVFTLAVAMSLTMMVSLALATTAVPDISGTLNKAATTDFNLATATIQANELNTFNNISPQITGATNALPSSVLFTKATESSGNYVVQTPPKAPIMASMNITTTVGKSEIISPQAKTDLESTGMKLDFGAA